jgi:hypothetical protein
MESEIISPAYVGFYHVPLSWFAEIPPEDVWRRGTLEALLKVVYEGTLEGGLRFRVRRDGFIWFDCNEWEPGMYTIIPGYSLEPGNKVPKKVTEAERLAEQRAHNRSMLLNAYQLCLNSAHSFVKKRSTGLGAPVQSTYLIHLTDFTNPISLFYASPNEPYCTYVNNAVDAIAKRNPKSINSRRLIEYEVIDYSFNLLNQILKSKNKGAVKITEMLYWAHHRYSENAFSDSLILSWAVCEKLINHLWGDFVRSKKGLIEGAERMNKDRVKKLEGRDFTASIVTEVLELSGVIDLELFCGIDDARRKRNAWLHSLDAIEDRDASSAMRTAIELFKVATNVALRPAISRTMPGTGGVPRHMYGFDSSAS